MRTPTDIAPKLAKLVQYDSEVLRAIDLPQERLSNIYNRARSGKNIINWIGAPLLALALITHSFAKYGDEENRWRNLGIFAANVMAFVAVVGIGGTRFRNARREIDEARDARLVTLAKVQPKNTLS